MAHRADDNIIKPCRKCGNQVAETTEKCPKCGIYAPGIESRCPRCGSENYIWKPYGVNLRAAFGGMVILGPIGSFVGSLLGSNDTECVCLQCGQGWMPFAFPGGKWSTTRRFKLEKK